MRLFNSLISFIKRNVIALSIVFASVVISAIIIKDPLHLRFSNFKLNVSKEESSMIASWIKKECEPVGNKQDCFKEKLSPLTKLYGIATGEAILSSLQDLNDQAKNCHVIAHYMAREAYKRNPNELFKLVDTINVNACGSGFLHGVLEAYTGDHPEIEVNGAFANEICGRGTDGYRQRMCIHFVGHVLLVNAYGNIEEALPLCATVRNEWKFDCYNGVFMEDHQKLALSEHGISPLPELGPELIQTLEKRCNTYDGIEGKACWTEMAEMYAHTFGYLNPDVIFKGCSKAKDPTFARACYFKGVIALSTYMHYNTAPALTSLCAYYRHTPSIYLECTDNILAALMYYSPKFASRGITLCSNVDKQYAKKCFENLGGRLQAIVPDKEELREFCKGTPEEYLTMCTG